MNTGLKAIKRPRCELCGDTFMVVGTTAIRLAFPRSVTRTYNEKTQEMRDDTGVCPKHPRSLGNEQ
jgi:hypothetical protein